VYVQEEHEVSECFVNDHVRNIAKIRGK
jgi:hypothetical protein